MFKRIIIALPLALALSTPALAFGPHHDGPPDPAAVEARVDEALDRVDATDEQRGTIQAIVAEAVPQLKALRDEARELREDIHAAFEGDTVDRTALETSRQDAVDLFDRFTAEAFDTLADLAEVLTPEQRQLLHDLREQRRQHLMERLHSLRG